MLLFQNKKYMKTKSGSKKNNFELDKFFRLYINAIKTKQLFFIYNNLTPKVLNLIKCLESNSRIAGYNVTAGRDEVKIFLNYDLTKNEPLIQKVILFSSRGRKRIATEPMLNLFHHHYPYSLGIIGTRYGIKSSRECQIKNYGGEFIASIT